VRPVLAKNFGEQQAIANVFYDAKLLPKPLVTGQALIWDFDKKQAVPALPAAK
jgi:sulfonate transport system substrate-binding protein